MSPLEQIVRDALRDLGASLEAQVSDPAERAAVAAMAGDLAMIPVRLAYGQDVAELTAALRAEAANRALAHRVRAEIAARDAWVQIVNRLLIGAIAGAAT